MAQNTTFRRSRCRKQWEISTIQLRMQDAMEALEPVFHDDNEKMDVKIRAAHAYAKLANQAQKAYKDDKLEQRITKMEELLKDKES